MATDRPLESPASREGWWSRLLGRLRGLGVGTEDPNIVGDAGPYDVAPGRDPDGGELPVEEADRPLEAETLYPSELAEDLGDGADAAAPEDRSPPVEPATGPDPTARTEQPGPGPQPGGPEPAS